MRAFLGLEYSPLDTMVKSEERVHPLWLKELRDLARGFCGALFVALPLLYTMEMWERALLIPAWVLVLFMGLTYFANVGYIMFAGYKPEPERITVWSDALVSLGLGALGSMITLFLINRYDFHTPLQIVARMVLLQTVPTSFGASVAIKQLGVRTGYRDEGDDQPAARFSPDLRKILATILGALFFSFNIAPTVEPQYITYSESWGHLLLLILFSLFISSLMVFFADFVKKEEHRGLLGQKWVETLVSYLISLAVSALLLLFFGYITFDTPFPLALAWTITLGYVTTLGGSAGRLIL